MSNIIYRKSWNLALCVFEKVILAKFTFCKTNSNNIYLEYSLCDTVRSVRDWGVLFVVNNAI